MGNLQKYRSKNPVQRFLLSRFIDRAVVLAGRAPVGPVLDAGCGEGFLSEALRRGRPGTWTLCAMDLSRGALGYLRESRTAAAPMLGDVGALPFADGAFSLVVATEVLEHLPHPDAALAELCRVSGGLVLVSVPHEPFFAGLNLLRGKNIRRLGSDEDHRQHWTRAGFLRFVRQRLRILDAPPGVFPWTLVLGEIRR